MIILITTILSFGYLAAGFVEKQITPAFTLYIEKLGLDQEETKLYRNLYSKRFLPGGDGIIDAGEQGDDFNLVGGDGGAGDCSALEAGFECPNPGLPGVEICGDAVDGGTYEGDDGNPFPNDGGDDTCTLEVKGFTCNPVTPFPTICTEICGDGINYGNYAGDDGNTAGGDGCSSTCSIEQGFGGDRESGDDICGDGLNGGGTHVCDDGNVIFNDGGDHRCQYVPGFTCSATFPTTGEENCDAQDYYFNAGEDYNAVNGDGCTNNCEIEHSYQCEEGDPLNPDVCIEIGGDGYDYFNYHCDDGNYNSGDGCSVLCLPEVGYQCVNGTNDQPDICPEICGDGLNFGWYQGDDGNLINGDGCDDTCQVEFRWRCYDGTPTRKDTCEEKCGDGIDLKINACEDSNVLEWDGGNRYCDMEEGWVCSGGNVTHADICKETFGDGGRVGTEEGDDLNLVDGDGGSALMIVETGYVCTGGNLTTSKDDFCTAANYTISDTTCSGISTEKDTCTEICGDGLNVNVWEGDDGNLRNYDGGNSICGIEDGWTCTGGSNITADTCTMLPRPYVEEVFVSLNGSVVTVWFNEAVRLFTGWNETDVSMYITGDQEVYNFTYSLRNASSLESTGSDEFYFDIDVKDQVAGYGHERVHIQFDNDEFMGAQATTLKLLNWTVSTHLHQQASKHDDQCGLKYPIYLFWISFIGMIFAVMFYCYKYMHSMTPLWMIISSLQILFMHGTMDLYIPTGLLDFYRGVGKLVFLELPALRNMATPAHKDGMSLRFNDTGFDSPVFLANAIGGIFALFFLVPLILMRYLQKKNIKNERLKEVIRRYWQQWTVVILLLVYARLAFAGAINFEVMTILDSDILTASSVLTVYGFMTLLMLMLFFLYVGVHTYQRTKDDRISIELGNQRPEMANGSRDPSLPATRIMAYMLEDIDIRKGPAPFHYVLYFLRLTIWAFALVKLRRDEIAALCLLTIMNTIYLLWMIHVRPFKSNLNNRLGIFVETCTLLVTLCIFPYIRAWPPRDIFISFARYQFFIIWIMVLGVPALIIGDHIWHKFIAKEDYYQKPHRTIFEKRPRAKKMKKVPVPDTVIVEAEGEGESEPDEPEEEKKEEKKEEVKVQPSATSSYYSEGEESEFESQTEKSKQLV